MNLQRAFIAVLLLSLALSLVEGCATPGVGDQPQYPGPRAHPDGTPVAPLSYTNEPVPWKQEVGREKAQDAHFAPLCGDRGDL